MLILEAPLESKKQLEYKLYLKKEDSKALKQQSRDSTLSACSADRYLFFDNLPFSTVMMKFGASADGEMGLSFEIT